MSRSATGSAVGSAGRPGRLGALPAPGKATPGPVVTALAVSLVGLVVTGVVSWSAWRLDRSNEQRLVEVQTRQAGQVISAAIVGIQAPLQTALALASATSGSVSTFSTFAAPYTRPGGLFTAMSLWRMTGTSPILVVTVGPSGSEAAAPVRTLVARATRSSIFVVANIPAQPLRQVGYALARPGGSGYVIFAERAIPANRRAPVASNAAFADLHYATYLGSTADAAALETTDVPPGRLPLSGVTARVTVPFGDTTLTLVTTPSRHLGGGLSQRLWWLLLAGGIVLASAAAVTAARTARGRRRAETDAATISTLYEQLDGLYSTQRTVSETLQHALLPQTNPIIAGLEIATRYVAGADGVDVGGDWYSVAHLDADHFGFVIGDVSGRGVNAAAVMARIRFTLSAYLAEHHPPDEALELTAHQVDLRTDEHLATVLVGVGDLHTGQLALANAGHLPPLIITHGAAEFADVPAGPPLGVETTASYPATSLTLAPGSVLLAYTDGLVERRTEDLDTGLGRLARTAVDDGSMNDLLTHLLDTMLDDGAHDDVAALALRWIPIERADPQPAITEP